jgi:hydrogenase/urease accessory protein HupE
MSLRIFESLSMKLGEKSPHPNPPPRLQRKGGDKSARFMSPPLRSGGGLGWGRKCIEFLGALFLLSSSFTAHADIFRPAYLELREVASDAAGAQRYDVMWKVPAQGDMRLAVQVVFPNDTTQLTQPQGMFNDNAYVERWKIERQGGLVGQSVRIEGVAGGVTDVIARVERLDGTSQVERLQPQDPQFVVKASAGTGEVAWSYLVLGVEHILGGIDHLLFVLALLFIVRGSKRIVVTITAFTLAHSITLVAASLGLVHVPGPPVEAIIALSIVFVAVEIVHGLRGKQGLTARAPWVVAFSFGLLHGFGFAGALAEVGLPQTAIPVALLMFNVGVEVGQLLFVSVALLLGAALARTSLRREWMPYAVSYAIGGVAMFWTIERIGSFWG